MMYSIKPWHTHSRQLDFKTLFLYTIVLMIGYIHNLAVYIYFSEEVLTAHIMYDFLPLKLHNIFSKFIIFVKIQDWVL